MNFLTLFKDFYLLFYRDRSARLYVVASIIGLAFSLSVVLSTLGLMDGFTHKMRSSLNEGHGDITMLGKYGFFDKDEVVQSSLTKVGVTDIVGLVSSQGFAIKDNLGKAVLVQGVDESYKKIKEIEVPKKGTATVSEGLAEYLEAKVGDEVTITFAAGRKGESSLPTTISFKISSIHKFQMHHLNERSVFIEISELQNILSLDKKVNILNLKLKKELRTKEKITSVVFKIRELFYYDYSVYPFWSDFGSFLEAVEYEKRMIAIVLCIIVIMAIFNILSFIVYSKEKKAQEIFLLYSIGLSPVKFRKLWLLQNAIIWALSFILSMAFVEIFNWALQNLSIFKLPSEVYHFGSLEIMVSIPDMLMVMGVSFFFVFLLTYLMLQRVNSKSLASGLRQEFS